MSVLNTATERLPVEKQKAFTIEQGARLFGRHPSWLYRRIYLQEVKVLNTGGRLMISRKEIDRLLSRESAYCPRRRKSKGGSGVAK
jgi:Helix-turn-helix domain